MPESARHKNRPSHTSGNVTFADADAAALLADHVDVLNNPQGRLEQIKQNASRTVFRGHIGDVEFYLKHFHSRTIPHRLARIMGFSEAGREMRFSQYLTDHGVPTPPPLAMMCGGGKEWLVTKAVAPATPADQWHLRQLHSGPEGWRTIQKVIVALGSMIGRMHAAGVMHGDLHCGNVLVRTDTDPPKLVLTDLHRVRRRRKISRRARVINLAQLFHDRFTFTSRTERLRFLTEYLRVSGESDKLRSWQQMIERFAARHTRRQHAQRDRRIFGRNQYFSPITLPGGWRGNVVLASKRRTVGSKAADMVFEQRAWQQALSNPDALFSGDGVEVIKDSKSSQVVRRKLQIGEHSVDVFIKRPRRKKSWKILADCFRQSRPARAFQLGHSLLTRRIPTALPLATLRKRIGPLLIDSILITEAVDACHLNKFLNTWLSSPPKGDRPLDAQQQHRLGQDVLWQLGRVLQRLHDNCFRHRDLKATNLLVYWKPDDPPSIVLVDLDGVSQVRRVTMRQRFQGLMRLNVSLLECPVVNRAGRLRMLLGYFRRPGSGRIEFKPYWRVLDEWSAKKLQQQIRSRRKRQKAVRRPKS